MIIQILGNLTSIQIFQRKRRVTCLQVLGAPGPEMVRRPDVQQTPDERTGTLPSTVES
jgi:hypothetical protein